jgi:hypothetical protein
MFGSNGGGRKPLCAAWITAAALAFSSLPLCAQIDLSGSWAPRNHEDALDRGAGPYLVDYSGLPLNEAGRLRALSFSASSLSEPERVCLFYPPFYVMLGPFGMRIWSEADPATGTIIAWKIGSWEDRAANIIWMDGRPHPSKNAPHEKTGFSTGTWQGDVLTVDTTHIKAGYIRRNGAPSSDEAVMTQHFLRHGDILTLTTMLNDPLYLAEPIFWSKTFQLDAAPISPVGPPCVQGDEGVEEGTVPHHLPGKNPFVDELQTKLGIPTEAILGGPETMYPEFHKKIKDSYHRPEKCVRSCGGPVTRPQ